MVEQQKQNGPELPLVPVKQQYHGSGRVGPQNRSVVSDSESFGASGASEAFLPSSPNLPSRSTIAAVGFDQLTLLWNVYGDCDNHTTLKRHRGVVMEHYTQIVVCSSEIKLWQCGIVK